MAMGLGPRGTQIAYLIVVLIAVVLMSWYAINVTPYPTEEFTPDGNHLGDFRIGNSHFNIFQLIFGEKVDENWVVPTNMVQYLFLPFFAIWLVMYGIFEEITFFRRVTWFGPGMALVTALIVSSTGFLVRMMRGYLMIAGGMGIAFFGFILVLGLGFWFIGRLGRFGIPVGSVVAEFKEVGEIENAFREAKASANIIGLDEPEKAAKIKGLIALGEEALGRTPPNLNIARRRLNDIRKLISS